MLKTHTILDIIKYFILACDKKLLLLGWTWFISFQLDKIQIGVIKVVSKIKKRDIPSTPKLKLLTPIPNGLLNILFLILNSYTNW